MNMQINWNKCSEIMPPDDDKKIILICNGVATQGNGKAAHKLQDLMDMEDVLWMHYIEEAWKEVNK